MYINDDLWYNHYESRRDRSRIGVHYSQCRNGLLPSERPCLIKNEWAARWQNASSREKEAPPYPVAKLIHNRHSDLNLSPKWEMMAEALIVSHASSASAAGPYLVHLCRIPISLRPLSGDGGTAGMRLGGRRSGSSAATVPALMPPRFRVSYPVTGRLGRRQPLCLGCGLMINS